MHPTAQSLMLGITQALEYGFICLELILRISHEAGREDGGFRRAQPRGSLSALAPAFVRRATSMPKMRCHAVECRRTYSCLRASRIHIGCHTERDATVRIRAVKLYSFFDLLRIASGYLAHSLQVVIGTAILIGLESRLAFDRGAILERHVNLAE